MKRIWVAVVFVVLALWIGYDLGYHHATRNERAAWETSEVVELEQDNAPPTFLSKASGPPLARRIKIDRKDSLGVYYANPHVTMGYEVASQPVVNTPDPRNTPVK